MILLIQLAHKVLLLCLLLNYTKSLFQAVDLRHHKVGETDEPAMYRIKDDLVLSPSICSVESFC